MGVLGLLELLRHEQLWKCGNCDDAWPWSIVGLRERPAAILGLGRHNTRTYCAVDSSASRQNRTPCKPYLAAFVLSATSASMPDPVSVGIARRRRHGRSPRAVSYCKPRRRQGRRAATAGISSADPKERRRRPRRCKGLGAAAACAERLDAAAAEFDGAAVARSRYLSSRWRTRARACGCLLVQNMLDRRGIGRRRWRHRGAHLVDRRGRRSEDKSTLPSCSRPGVDAAADSGASAALRRVDATQARRPVRAHGAAGDEEGRRPWGGVSGASIAAIWRRRRCRRRRRRKIKPRAWTSPAVPPPARRAGGRNTGDAPRGRAPMRIATRRVGGGRPWEVVEGAA